MKRNFLVILVLLFMLIASSPQSYAAWYDEYIGACQKLGALKNDTHSPNDFINRLETACLIDCVAKANSITFEKKENHSFFDINDCDKNAQESIKRLADSQVICGYTDGSFKPYNDVTRAELASIISKSFFKSRKPSPVTPFSDISSKQWYFNCVSLLNDLGIISGYKSGSLQIFKPNSPVTHAEASKIVLLASKKSDISKPDKNKNIPDNNSMQIDATIPSDSTDAINTISQDSTNSTYSTSVDTSESSDSTVTEENNIPSTTTNANVSEFLDEQSDNLSESDLNDSVAFDQNLERAIHEYILEKNKIAPTDKELNKPLTDNEILSLDDLNLEKCNLTSLKGLRKFVNLVNLKLSENNISDISELAYLKKLNRINLDHNNISDISPLSNLTKIEYISLSVNNISDFSPLSGNKGLRSLFIKYNKNPDLSFLSSFPILDDLDISGNNIEDISTLVSLKNLQFLYMIDNRVHDISCLKNLPIKILFIENNPIMDYSPIQNKTLLVTDYQAG